MKSTIIPQTASKNRTRIVERIVECISVIVERILQHIIIEKYYRPGEGPLRLLEGFIIALMIYFFLVVNIFES